MRITVVQVTQSPMNELRWLIKLSCGHDYWTTRKDRPRFKTAYCSICQHRKEQERMK